MKYLEEIEILITAFMKDKKYINALTHIHALFEKYNLSYSERNKILQKIDEYNQQIYKEEKKRAKQLTELESIKWDKSIEKKETMIPTIETSIPKKDKSTIFIDVSSYLKQLKTANADLNSILPDKDTEQYAEIINSILIQLYKEKVEIINLLHEQNIEEKDVMDMFLLEIDFLDNLMEQIIDIRDFDAVEEDMIENISTNQKNQLWILKNSVGKPYLLSSLKGKEEYYGIVKALLESMMDGTFKNFKYVSPNYNYLMKLMEVKDRNGVRILFSRLNQNMYVIIDAYVKRSTYSIKNQAILHRASKLYQQVRGKLMDDLNCIETVEKEKQYTKELFLMLDEKKREVDM